MADKVEVPTLVLSQVRARLGVDTVDWQMRAIWRALALAAHSRTR